MAYILNINWNGTGIAQWGGGESPNIWKPSKFLVKWDSHFKEANSLGRTTNRSRWIGKCRTLKNNAAKWHLSHFNKTQQKARRTK